MKLYEINEKIGNLLMMETGEAVDTETGEVLTKEELDALNMERDEKIENCLLFLKNINLEITGVEAEKSAFDARLKRLKNKRDWVQNYVATSIGKDNKFSTTRVVASVKESVKTIIDDESSIPVGYFVEKTTRQPDKKAIKAAINGGTAIAGAHLEKCLNLSLR